MWRRGGGQNEDKDEDEGEVRMWAMRKRKWK
jgi:hypothetical protein